MGRFDGRRIAATGAAGGIGLAICSSLTEQGAQVYGLDMGGLERLPAGVAGVRVDVTDEASTRAARSTPAASGRSTSSPVGIVEDNVAAEEMSLAQWDAVLAVDPRGVFQTCREFGRELLARGGGAIVNMASNSSRLAATSGVSTYPGETAFTRTPRGPHSTASEQVSALTPALEVL